MKMKQLTIVCFLVGLTGCVFSGTDPEAPLGGGFDTSTPANNDDTDMATGDTRAPNNSANDMSRPINNGTPDQGRPNDQGTPDVGVDMAVDMSADMEPDMEPDMPPAELPFVIAAEHTIGLGGAASTDEPMEIAELATGFLIGYVDGLSDRAIFGWYTSDDADVVDSIDYPADLLPIDVATTSAGGFGIFVSSTEYLIAHFTPSVVGTPSLNPVLIPTTADTMMKRELAVDVEADDIYVLLNSIFNSTNLPRVELNLADEDEWGYADDSLRNVNLTNIELLGGESVVGRRLLAAGVVSGVYRLIDYNFDIAVSPFWAVEPNTCGAAPTDPRIMPIGDQWALIEFEGPNGRNLHAVECVPVGDSVTTRNLVTSSNQVMDFDVAKEDLHVGSNFGLTWIDAGTPMFGVATLDTTTNTVNLLRSMPLPGMGRRVRAAYNASRNQWAVAVTTINSGSRIVILEENPNFTP